MKKIQLMKLKTIITIRKNNNLNPKKNSYE